ncbi:MAG: hypothetical protein ACLFM1_02880 [Bacteroidales bacterium]
MKRRHRNILLVLLACTVGLLIVHLVFFDKKGRLDVNVSDIEVDMDIKRFDQDLFDYDVSLETHVAELEDNYPRFFFLFTEQIIRIGNTGDKNFYEYLEAFLKDYSVEQAKTAADKEFSDISDLESSLKEGFRHYRYYFPEKEVPEIVTFVAGFNHSVVTDEDLIGIGLDKYLGADSELYAKMKIPEYAVRNMRKEMIPVDCMKALAQMEYPNQDSSDYLVFEMIYQGKLMYFLDAMFPAMPDSLKIGYSARDISYCRHFEQSMWEHMVSEELLYSTDYLKQRKYTGEAPFTAAFGNDSPGRTGVWIGWQIVRAYMKSEDVSLPELMQETDYQKILNRSRYQPKI